MILLKSNLYILSFCLFFTLSYSCGFEIRKNSHKTEQEMIDFLHNTALYLCKDSIDANDIVKIIGSVKDNPGPPLPLEILSETKGVDAAQLFLYPDSGYPYLLTFHFAPEVHLTVSALEKAFGAYQQMATDRGMPLELTFSSPVQGENWWVYIFVELEKSDAEIETRKIVNIKYRRDPFYQ